MSRNNLIIVVNDKRGLKEWFYVIINANADNEWNYKFFKKKIQEMRKEGKRTRQRSTALLLAHDIDNKIKTEYGVREFTIKK
tara:strand:+ start:688 stop:933 length:246 start_codon:yes stop_codon:yes gene_type:complete